MPATHSARGVTRHQGARKPDPSAPPSAMSATPATQNDDVWNCATPATRNDGGWEIGPCLPRQTMVDPRLGEGPLSLGPSGIRGPARPFASQSETLKVAC